MDDSNQRTEKLREQLKAANQKILFYQSEEAKDSTADASEVAQLKRTIEEKSRFQT